MYTKKNKALSLVEIIVSISLISIILYINFIFLSAMNKSFIGVKNFYKREKEFVTSRELINSHIIWSEAEDYRISTVSEKKPIKSFEKIFKNTSESEGNFLVLKIKSFKIDEKNIYHQYSYYRCFLFFKNELRVDYYDSKNLHAVVDLTNIGKNAILKDCSGKFLLKNKNLKFQIKDENTGKIYEEIIF